MKDNDGYIKVVAAMQKFFDQAISGNWSYNPENYDNNEVPVSIMGQDFLKTYKYGWKTSYYQNTYDQKGDEPELTEEKKESIKDLLTQILDTEEEDCDTATKFRKNGEPMRSKVDGMTVFNTTQLDSTKQKMFFGPPLGVQRYDKFKYPCVR